MLLKHAALQFGAAALAFTLWVAADSWYLLTGLGLAAALSVALAALAGIAISTVMHEWGHLAGAALTGSHYSVTDKPGLFVYDFDFEKNSLRQFNRMSAAGQLGGLLAAPVLFALLPMDNPGRIMLVCSALGSAVFAGIIEWPVIRRAQRSGQPQAELGKINAALIRRSGYLGAGCALLLWLVAIQWPDG